MGFFYNGVKGGPKKSASSASKKHIPIQSMNQIGCKACPLDKTEADLKTPKMDPIGAPDAELYVLRMAPSADDDRKGEPNADSLGKILKRQLPFAFERNHTRFNNIIRCHPLDHPERIELAETECCRGYIVKDIEETKPLVIVGAGDDPLVWATGLSGGTNTWRGRLIATKIGKHPVWYMPTFSPELVDKKKNDWGRKSEYELCFEHDIKAALDLIQRGKLRPPIIYEAPYDRGIEIVTGESSSDFQTVEDYLNSMLTLPRVGIDLETTALRPYHAHSKILTAAIGTFDKSIAFALDHPASGWSDNRKRQLHGLLCEFLLFSGRKIAHNSSFEMEWLGYKYGEKILRLTEWEDTMVQCNTLDERPGGNGLDDQCREHFGFFLKAQSRVDVKRILEYPLREVLRYNGMDTKWCFKLYEYLEPKINAVKNYRTEYERKMRMEPSLVAMQIKGVPVDFDYAEQMLDKFQTRLSSLEAQIQRTPEVKAYEKRFGSFRPTAPEDVVQLMDAICKRDEVKKALGGRTSDEEALNKIPASEVPSAPLILEHRTVSKLISTNIDPIITRKIVYPDGHIHTKYNSMVAVTGRLSSQDPNQQNWPKRKNVEVRGIIAALAGHWICAADYGQIEARVIGMASEDKNLVEYLWTDYDIHGHWADRFLKAYRPVRQWVIDEFGVDPDDDKLIRKTLRQEAKNRWVFPQFFGSSYKSCAREMHVPDDIAQDLSEEFWSEFDGVLRWQKKLISNYEKNLYVETLTGRRRRGAITKNQLINHPIQGTALDIVTAAMDCLSEKAMIIDVPDYQCNINVHDDLTFFLPDEPMDEELDCITSEMCRHRFDFINVPLIVEVSVGARWHELKEVGKWRSDKVFDLPNPYA